MRPVAFVKEFDRLNRAGDISQELRARLFAVVFWIMAGLAVLGLVLTGALVENSVLPRVMQLTTLGIFLAIWSLYKRNHLTLATTLMVWGFWVLATTVVLSEAGRASHWLVTQFLIVVLARFLSTGRMAILLAAVTAVVDFSIYQFHLHSIMPMELRELTLGNDWVAIAISFFFLMFIFYLIDAVVRETLRVARVSQGRYQSLFDKTNDAVFLIDMNLSYIDANQQAAELLGYQRDEIIGKSIYEVVPQEESTAVRVNFQKLDKEGSLPLFERTLIRADGTRRIAEVSITVVPEESGNQRYYQSVMRDVTQRKRLEEQLRYSLEEMETLAMQDSLTGLLNRRAITEHAEAEWHRSKRERRAMCVGLVDLDNLKDVNDNLGHLVGDKTILMLGSVIKDTLRRYDWAGRWGGDEFMLVLPGSNLVDAQEACERLRAQYASQDFITEIDASIRPYLSVGVACYSGRAGDEITLNQLFGQADKALYSAKQHGKNRVEVYRDEDQQVAQAAGDVDPHD